MPATLVNPNLAMLGPRLGEPTEASHSPVILVANTQPAAPVTPPRMASDQVQKSNPIWTIRVRLALPELVATARTTCALFLQIETCH